MGRYKSKESEQKVEEARMRGLETRKRKTEKSKEDYKNNPKLCLQCSKEMDYKLQKYSFCSQSCAAIYNNACRTKVIRSDKINQITCLNCGDLFFKRYKSDPSVYCSMECCSDYMVKKTNQRIENDEIVSSSRLRIYLMKKYDNKCQKCGWGIPNPASNTVCLDMHHIDGNSKNNKLSNVELLCPNCHCLTPNYKRVNKEHKSSRTERKK